MVFYVSLTPPKAGGIVIHAASVGEVIAATPLVQKLQQNYPHLPITFTTVTPTGSDRVKAAFGDSVSIVICLTIYLVPLIVLLTLFNQNFVL